jgi:hypothetical protein
MHNPCAPSKQSSRPGSPNACMKAVNGPGGICSPILNGSYARCMVNYGNNLSATVRPPCNTFALAHPRRESVLTRSHPDGTGQLKYTAYLKS